jgi:hypothetical protein
VSRIFKSGRYANVTSTLALVVALSGTAYAAVTITGKNVRNGSLTGADVKKNSIGSKQVAGLQANDFKTGTLRTGPIGPQGPPGAQGAPGSAGTPGAPGSALAYARVSADGTVDAGVSQGISVLDSGFGLYCLDYTGGSVRNFQVTLDISGADSRKNQVSGTAVASSIALGGACPAGTDVEVATADNQTPATVPAPFYIAIIG